MNRDSVVFYLSFYEAIKELPEMERLKAFEMVFDAFPMSARVVHKMGLEEDNQNFLLMHSIGVNVSGQIASVIAGGLIMALVKAKLGG